MDPLQVVGDQFSTAFPTWVPVLPRQVFDWGLCPELRKDLIPNQVPVFGFALLPD